MWVATSHFCRWGRHRSIKQAQAKMVWFLRLEITANVLEMVPCYPLLNMVMIQSIPSRGHAKSAHKITQVLKDTKIPLTETERCYANGWFFNRCWQVILALGKFLQLIINRCDESHFFSVSGWRESIPLQDEQACKGDPCLPLVPDWSMEMMGCLALMCRFLFFIATQKWFLQSCAIFLMKTKKSHTGY